MGRCTDGRGLGFDPFRSRPQLVSVKNNRGERLLAGPFALTTTDDRLSPPEAVYGRPACLKGDFAANKPF